jgi:hypothetical protein
MKVTIIDDNHIMLVASEREVVQYANHSRVLIDNKNSFVCNSEPSSTAFVIERPVGGSLFNVSLDISYSRFTTKELLIIYVELDDLTYPFVIPCYDNEMLMNFVAKKAGILDAMIDCKCDEDISMVYPIIIYYGFKLALATFDIRTAIKYWERLFGSSTNITTKCGCHGK